MKGLTLVVLLSAAVGALGQDAVPGGTILPVQLNSSLRSNGARAGQTISARIMQDVPLDGHWKIRAGAKVIGHVIDARTASSQAGGLLSFRFDALVIGNRHIPLTTNLRAMATMMDVSEAQVPESGPDRGTSEYNWTTDQIGGEVAIHGGAGVIHGSDVVGWAEGNGVLVRASAKPDTQCRGAVEGNDRLQALWVFSSDACGLYDLPDLFLVHAGRSDPVGHITIEARVGRELKIPSGSGMLLRVTQAASKN